MFYWVGHLLNYRVVNPSGSLVGNIGVLTTPFSESREKSIIIEGDASTSKAHYDQNFGLNSTDKEGLALLLRKLALIDNRCVVL